MVKEQYISTFGLLQIWGNYLYECGYNTAEELLNMNVEEMETRYNNIINGSE